MGNTISEFEHLCTRLESNDRKLRIVNSDNFHAFYADEAKQLGDALENNRHVQQLIMDVSCLDGTSEGVRKIANFLNTSQSLKAVFLKSPGSAARNFFLNDESEETNSNSNIADVIALFLDSVSSNERIEELVLGDVDLTIPAPAFLQLLTKCQPKLRRMRIAFGGLRGDVGYDLISEAFEENTTLRGLELACTSPPLWAASLEGLSSNMALQSLHLDRINRMSELDPLADFLVTNKSLEELHITQSPLGSRAVGTLVSSLIRNEQIKELRWINCGLNKDDAVHLKRLLRQCSNLSSLMLSRNMLGVEGFRHVAEGLYRNRTLSVLDIADNDLGGLESGRLAGNLLRRNKGLTRIDLDRNDWGLPSSIMAVAEGLAMNAQVKELDFSSCHLHDHATAILASVGLARNKSLRVLALANNNITFTGLQALLNHYHKGSLTSLVLSYNRLGKHDALAIGTDLMNCDRRLKSLFLDGNDLDDAGVRSLVQMLQTNKTLELLSFEDSEFGDETMQVLCESLKLNSTLRRIDFTFHESEAWVSLWHNTLRENTGLVEVNTPGLDAMAVADNFEADLDFFAWRNRFGRFFKSTQNCNQPAPLGPAAWAPALSQASERNLTSVLYHVLREGWTAIQDHQSLTTYRGRKRQRSRNMHDSN